MQTDDDLYGYWKQTIDLTHHLHLFYDRVLVTRIAAERTQAIDNREIPFYRLCELGRKESIRGFTRGRFRDLDMLMGSIEYR